MICCPGTHARGAPEEFEDDTEDAEDVTATDVDSLRRLTPSDVAEPDDAADDDAEELAADADDASGATATGETAAPEHAATNSIPTTAMTLIPAA